MMLNSCTFFLIITVLVLKGELGDTMSRCVRDDENAVCKGYMMVNCLFVVFLVYHRPYLPD